MLTVEITTERDYRIASAEAERLAVLLAQQDRETAHLPLQIRQALHGATATRLQEIQERLASYDQLRRSGGATIELNTIHHLPELLVHARVAANMTQKELAARLGVSEQQVQKDEKTRYAGASFQRLVGICGALSLHVRLHAVLPSVAQIEDVPEAKDQDREEGQGPTQSVDENWKTADLRRNLGLSVSTSEGAIIGTAAAFWMNGQRQTEEILAVSITVRHNHWLLVPTVKVTHLDSPIFRAPVLRIDYPRQTLEAGPYLSSTSVLRQVDIDALAQHYDVSFASVDELSQVSPSPAVSASDAVIHPDEIEPITSPIEELDTPSVP